MSMAISGTKIRTLQLGMEWFPEQRDGGLNRFYHDLLRYLPEARVEVQGLVAGSSEVARTTGGEVRAFAPPTVPLLRRWWSARRSVARVLADKEIALVVSHFALYTFPVLDLIKTRPLVVHFHGPWALESRVEGARELSTQFKGSVERTVYRRGARFIVLSTAFRDILLRDYGVPAERIWVIPAGVNTDFFAPDLTQREAREQLGWPQSRPIVLTVRRLVRRMGLDDLIMAMSKVRRRVPESLLLVVGKGPLAGELSTQVRSLNMENNVRFLGGVSDKDLISSYRAADLVVIPSVNLEGFGLVAIESLAAGTPVLVNPIGGLPDVVRHLSPRLVLPESGVGPLAEGLEMALTGDLVLPSAAACRAYARTRYDWRVIAARVREAYTDALK
jgi:glycogen synthase